MARLRSFLAGVAAAYGVALIAGAAFVYAGAFDVAASDPHGPVTSWLMATARIRSIRAHAAGISAAPAGLKDATNEQIGVAHYAAHCAVCHGAPGVPKDDIAQGMYPQPPDLADAVKIYSDAELFWIVKHGIKMTGMPAWGDHSDAELWAIVAFLRKLPGLTEQQYAELIKANMMHGMTMHHSEGTMPSAPPR